MTQQDGDLVFPKLAIALDKDPAEILARRISNELGSPIEVIAYLGSVDYPNKHDADVTSQEVDFYVCRISNSNIPDSTKSYQKIWLRSIAQAEYDLASESERALIQEGLRVLIKVD